MQRLAGAALIGLLVSIGPAQGGGSIALNEVLERTQEAAQLQEEISNAVGLSEAPADDIVCSAVRIGKHIAEDGGIWENFGGARIAPYECEIGGRQVTIRAKGIGVFNEDGDALSESDDTSTARIRESDFEWEWSDLPEAPAD